MSQPLVLNPALNNTEPVAARATRSAYVDVLRVAATVAVVMIHVAGQGVVHTELVSRSSWLVAVFLDGASRWSVPMFVMISGALLLEPTEQTIGTFFRRRVARVGIPLLFWSILYLFWRRYYLGETQLNLATSLRAFYLGTPAFHLYFLFLIFGLYLFTPMLRAFVRRGNRTELIVVTTLALSIASINHTLRPLMGMWIQHTAFEMFVPYIGYYLAGYVLANTPGSTLGRCVSWAMLAVGLLVTFLGVASTKTAPKMNLAIELYYDYLSPSVVLMTLALFALTLDWYRRPNAVNRLLARICRWIAPACLGIYLIHPMALMELFIRVGMPVHPNTLLAAPFWTAAIFIVCLIACKLLQLIPGVRYILG